MDLLTRTEELILLSVWKLQDEAYGLEIRQRLSELLERKLSVGAVYVPLKRLKNAAILKAGTVNLRTSGAGGRSVFLSLPQKE